jgi:hypothetical protein
MLFGCGDGAVTDESAAKENGNDKNSEPLRADPSGKRRLSLFNSSHEICCPARALKNPEGLVLGKAFGSWRNRQSA